MEIRKGPNLIEERLVDDNGRGYLYLCPTPIGNLEDITYRTLKILSAVDYVAAEDTRNTGKLLAYYDLQKQLISYHEHNKEEKGNYLIALMEQGASVAIVSDAGMPAISDPGADIVSKAIEANLTIVPLPGANAALTALMASGLDTTEFTFLGFLPKRKKHRHDVLERVKHYEGTLLFYEAPHRIEEVLQSMCEVLGNRPVAIGREVTKKFETFTRTTLQGLVDGDAELTIKGEFVILVGGYRSDDDEGEEDNPCSVVEAVQVLIEEGISKKDAIRQVAKERNLARRDVYNAVEAALEEGRES